MPKDRTSHRKPTAPQQIAAQTVFDFGPTFDAPVAKRAVPTPATPSATMAVSVATPFVEVLEPVERSDAFKGSTAEDVAGSKHTHVFALHLRAHDMMMRAVIAFAVCVGLIVLIKGNVPLQEVGIGPIKLPPASIFFTGLLGLLSVAFAGIVVGFGLRSRDLRRMSGIPFHQTATGVSKALFVVVTVVFAIAMTIAVQLTYADMYALVRLVFFNAFVYPDGISGWQ